jgi:6-phosphogluconolactonase (cycloisomerase 2 family)
MTNAVGDNAVVVWARAADGTLTLTQTIATGGGGSGTQLDPTDSLGSQGGLMLDSSNRHLFAVNTETIANNSHDCQVGSITSFLVAADGSLTIADKVASGGLFPSSLTVQGNHLYVLNSGGPGLDVPCGMMPNITGFTVRPDGHLTPIAASTRTINPGPPYGGVSGEDCSGVGPFATLNFRCGLNPPAFPRGPGEVGFTPDGDALVVTVKGTNSIYVFPVSDGVPITPTVTQALGPNVPTYFGFAFDSGGHLIVSEPFGAATTIPMVPKSAVSSFNIAASGALIPISSDIANGQGTSCWVAIDPITQRYAYSGNNATSSISAYTIGDDGSLSLLSAVAAIGNKPNDLAVAKDRGRAFLYVLNAGNGTVGVWQINRDGSLASLGAVGGLPADAGAQGLVAY